MATDAVFVDREANLFKQQHYFHLFLAEAAKRMHCKVDSITCLMRSYPGKNGKATTDGG